MDRIYANAPAADHEHMAAVRVLDQRSLELGGQAVHPGTHVSDAGGKAYLGADRQAAHVRKL